MTLGDKKFKTGYAKGFPSSKATQDTDEESEREDQEDEDSSDEDFRPSKRKCA